ncbi:MAG: amino acid adenylation domain-containing protein, partial [Anaerolineae bacterium]|nr:amino acid adenylation domain-containing protein [Anaerolineae bacterium]
GRLDVAALTQTLNHLLQRHEILRTTIQEVEGHPHQIIQDDVTLPLPVIDLQHLSPDEQTAELHRLPASLGTHPFDLSQDVMLRANLLRLKPDEFILFLTVHHIALDGWSLGILTREALTLYPFIAQQRSKGVSSANSLTQANPLPTLPLQYADFAHWQRSWLEADVVHRQLPFWQDLLAGSPDSLDLPTDHPRPPIQTDRGAHLIFTLPAKLSQAILALGQQAGATPFMTLLTAFKILLYRYSGQTDIVVGSAIANRTRYEIEAMVGFFVNTLALRTDLSGNPTFIDLLNQVRQMTQNAYEHQDVPFEMLVETLQIKRSLSHTPLFQVMFDFQNAPRPPLEISGLTLTDLDLNIPIAMFDMTLMMWEDEGRLVGDWEYNTDLFEAATIERMADHFQTMLTNIVANPMQSIARIPLLTEPEHRQLLVGWNDTRIDYAANPCLHQLFERQAAQTPDAVAVVYEDQQLTYQTLNQRANQLAHYLQSLGVGPDTIVGLCLEPSPDMVVAVLGILKAGGAYLPLDPAYPQARIAFMLADAQASLLIHQASMDNDPQPAFDNGPLTTLDLNRLSQRLSREATHNPINRTTSDHLAYIIYTSGSTGQPKGVMIPHANVTRLFTATQQWFHFGPTDVWTLFHSIAFDFSVWELWGALLHGGRVVLVPSSVRRAPEAFYGLLCQQQVTVLNQTPSAFRQLIWAEDKVGPASDLNLRLIIFGGEALDMAGLKPWFDRHGDQSPQLVNMYGITETTVHATYRPLTRADITQGSVIGRPIPDLQIYILDNQLQPVPIGVPGEMVVGGAGLARGYLGQPELTAERFIPNPFISNDESTASNNRDASLFIPSTPLRTGLHPSSFILYKTGDLARYLANGDIEYLGRNDQQVKIRGFRIELGEIEQTLTQHPAVQAAVVLDREDEAGHKYLVAYLVSQPGRDLAIPEIRHLAQQKLPAYMVPAAFVPVTTIPLTANGKIDRRALPAPDHARGHVSTTYVVPRTPTEELLAEVWAQVLNLDRVGIYDNFFELGGDSMLSIQVVAKAKAGNLPLSVQHLFQHQTIYALARSVGEASMPTPQTEPFSLITPEGYGQLPDNLEDAYPLTTLQAGMIFHSQYMPERAIYHDIFSHHLQAPFNLAAFQTALQEMVIRHPILRTSFALTGFSQALQLVHQQAEIPLIVTDIQSMSAAEQDAAINAWMIAEKENAFTWQQPPLIRFQIHRRSETTFNLSFCCHHAILDGWSVASLLTELTNRYVALLSQERLSSTPPAIAFRDFVALEQQALASTETQQYWQQQLAELMVLQVPRWPLGNQTTRGPQPLPVPISTEVSAGLTNLARQIGVPLKSVLLAAHLHVLSVLGNQTDVVTGLVTNGRPEEQGGEALLGLFLNTVPFRLSLLGGTWLELVQAVFEAEREMLPYRHYPYAEMQRQGGGQPLFDVVFNYIHFHVIRDIIEQKAIEPLGSESFTQNNFGLTADFSRDVVSEQIQFSLEYDERLFCAEQVNVIGTYYVRTLTEMVSHPAQPYPLFSPLSEAEQQQIVIEWNDTATDYPLDNGFHHLFEAQAERTPHAVAVVYQTQQLTYRQLNRQANQLAHHLQALGIGPETPVGLWVERSPEMLVGLLGILKAGGAYVPLDPSYPPERLAFMASDARLSFIVSRSSVVSRQPLVTQLWQQNPHNGQQTLIDVDALSTQLSQQPPHNPTSQTTPDNLAYVLYTSGSTGRPKGTLIDHRGLTNYLNWCLQAYHPEQGSGAPVNTALGFDATITSLLSPLLVGKKVVLLPETGEIEALDSALQADSDFSLVKITPAHLQLLNHLGHHRHGAHTFVVGGEALLGQQVLTWRQQNGGIRLVNEYGPTETVVGCCVYDVPPDFTGDSPIPIGRPIANMQIYILDHQLRPVPVGVVGQLYIGGVQVARGYLNQPALTAEKFIPDPFASFRTERPGTRLYKTGDLARYLPDGNIEFVGRLDHQVKLRGFRIELGEIEAVLSRHPAVQANVVIVREDKPGEKQLAAYIVPRRHDSPRSATVDDQSSIMDTGALLTDLQQHLKQQLPDHMIPTAWVVLDALPLTPNGKVNRPALPAPTPASRPNYVPPRNAVERRLVHLWQQVLNLPLISVQDNFFDLGGHSLVAIRLMAAVQQQFNRQLPLVTLFQNPTIAALAVRLGQQSVTESWSSLVAIQPRGSKPPFFCVPGAVGDPLNLYLLAHYLGSDQPFYGLQAIGLDGITPPYTTIEAMATHYLEAIRQVQPVGPYYLGGQSAGGKIAFEMAQQLLRQGEAVALLAILDTTPFAEGEAESASWTEIQWLTRFIDFVEMLTDQSLGITPELLEPLNSDEQTAYLKQRLEQINALPVETDINQLRGWIQVYKVTSQAVSRYVSRQAIPMPVTLFCPAAEPATEHEAKVNAWSEIGPVDFQTAPGSHISMMAEPHVRILAEKLTGCLKRSHRQ